MSHRHYQPIDLYLDYLQVERRLSDEAIVNAQANLHELEHFAFWGEIHGCGYGGTVGPIETLDAQAVGWFLGYCNNSDIQAIYEATFKDYYRFLLLEGLIDKDPMDWNQLPDAVDPHVDSNTGTLATRESDPEARHD